MSEICAASSVVSESCASRFSASSGHIFWRTRIASSAASARATCGSSSRTLRYEFTASVGVAEALVLDLRHRHVERFARFGLVSEVDAALDDADQVVPALRADVELLERGERFGVGGVDLEDVRVRRAPRRRPEPSCSSIAATFIQ